MPRPRKSSYGEDKPPYSYVALCAMAIHSSPSKMMMLSLIYKFILNNFPFYRKNSTCWQNSLRHNLSFNDCFVKVSKSSEHGGKGNYWTLHHDCTQMFQDGSFLRRKRRFLSKEDEAAFFLKENNKSVDSTSSSMCPSSEFQPSSYPITPRYLPLQALEGHPKNDYSVISSIQQGKSEKPTTRVKSFSIADILGIDSSEKRTASTARYSDITVFPSSYSYSYEASKTDSVHDTQERYHPYSFHTNYQTCLDLYHKTKPATLVYNGSPWDANRPGQLVYCDNLKVDSLKPHPLTALRPKVIMKYEYQNKRCICHSF